MHFLLEREGKREKKGKGREGEGRGGKGRKKEKEKRINDFAPVVLCLGSLGSLEKLPQYWGIGVGYASNLNCFCRFNFSKGDPKG